MVGAPKTCEMSANESPDPEILHQLKEDQHENDHSSIDRTHRRDRVRPGAALIRRSPRGRAHDWRRQMTCRCGAALARWAKS
jgi:hypothetical protein